MAQPSSPASLLDSFARSSESRSPQPGLRGSAARPFARPLGAQKVDVPRDEARILRKLKLAAITAGEDWFYHIPVPTKRKPGIAFIEGPSIKMTSDLARIYGNCVVETQVTDLGDAWIIEARFSDLETGFSLSRPHQQTKPAAAGERATGRGLESVLQAAISKAIRNVVATALPSLTEFGLKEARTLVLSELEADLNSERTQTIAAMGGMVSLQESEALLGRPAELWSAADLHQLRSLLRALKDGILVLGDLALSRCCSAAASHVSEGGGDRSLAEFASSPAAKAGPEIVLADLPQARMQVLGGSNEEVRGPQPATHSMRTRQRRKPGNKLSPGSQRKPKPAAPAVGEGAAP
jgi:hypothetical protein